MRPPSGGYNAPDMSTTHSAEAQPVVLSDARARRAMTLIILAQCAGMLGRTAFDNGFLLAYFSRLGIGSSSILYLLSLVDLMVMGLIVGAAVLADRHGKKRMGHAGQALMIVGYALIAAAAACAASPGMVLAAVAGGVGLYGIGYTLFTSGWLALLSPIVPEATRGRFLGRLRLSWSLASLIFFLAVTAVLKVSPTTPVFLVVILIVAALTFVRTLLYSRIPELEPPRPTRAGLLPILLNVLRAPGYLPFCAYVFLLMLFVGCCPKILNLLEKDVLGFGDSTVVLMGTMLLVGQMCGFFLGGTLVDRVGTKAVFLLCHFSFGAILTLFLARGLLPAAAAPAYIGALTLAFGLAFGASSICVTTEMLSLIPGENKSLAASAMLALQSGGVALSGFIGGKALALGVFSESWTLGSLTLSRYDTILLGCAVMIVLLVVALGMVPSVLGVGVKSQRWPTA